MNGLDPGQIAQNIVTYFGGANGGLIVLAALLVVGLLTAAHLVGPHLFRLTLSFGVGAWIAAFIVKTILTWA
jgi:hypothetical protein